MPKRLLIFCVTSDDDSCWLKILSKQKKNEKQAYGAKKFTLNMYLTYLILLWSGLCCSQVFGDNPGYRRRPTNWAQSEEKDDQLELLSKLRALVMEHQAKLKIMQQLGQLTKERELENRKLKEEDLPDVGDYSSFDASKTDIYQPIPFAVGPSDPRYWIPETLSNRNPSKISSETVEYDDEIEFAPENKPIIKSSDGVPTYKLKAPMMPNPKQMANNNDNNNHPDDIHAQKPSVVQKPLKIDDDLGIFVVAMVAGVSAAVTVALIAIGLAWYTLRKRIKAAESVDYPAYGVTGPNKDLLYPTEKKFAQSVDMFHYQQQKQKKLSLENKSNGETNDGFSDLDGEFEMDDGDYTVYECPGFAQTGEMEVKNPLFADEPITVVQKHQPAATDKATEVTEKSATKTKAKKSPKNISPDKESASSTKKK